MKYIDFKRYKLTTISRRINSKVYDLLKIFKQLPFKRYVISKFRQFKNIDFRKILNIYKFFDIRKINFSKYYRRVAVPSRKNVKPLLVVVGFFFLGALTYLNIPLFFNFDKSEIEKKIFTEFNIKSSINSKISYNFFPTPRLKIKNIVFKDLFKENKSIGKADATTIKLSFKNLIKKEKINFTSIFINQAILKVDLNNFKNYKKYFSEFDKTKSILFKKTNIEFYEGKNIVAQAINSNIKYKLGRNKKIVELDSIFLDDDIQITLENDTKERSKDISIKFKKNKLLVKINLLDVEKIVKGKALLKKNKNKFTSIFSYKDNKINLEKSNISNHFLNGNIDGYIEFFPFFNFDLNADLNSLNFNSIYNSLVSLTPKQRKEMFKINKKINGVLTLVCDKILSRRSIIDSFESRIQFLNGDLVIERLLLSSKKMGAADMTGEVKNDKKYTSLKFEKNIFIDSLKRFYNKVNIYNKPDVPFDLFISGVFDLVNLKLRLNEISDNQKMAEEDTNYIQNEFNDILLEDGYKSLFHYKKFKEFVRSITSEQNI